MMHKLPTNFEMEIQIVDHCNLRCDNCNHFANLAQKPWFMSKEEFEYSVKSIKEKFASNGLKRFMILGGEPFLHPQIKEFADFASNTFKDTGVRVDILTNGLVLQKYTSEEIDYYKSRNVSLVVTPYPNVKYSEQFEENVKNHSIALLHSRLFFAQNPVNEIPKYTSEYAYSKCSKYRIPCLCIRNYKIYSCPFGATIHLYNERFNKCIEPKEGDYLDIETADIDKLREFVRKGPKHLCQYCDHECLPVYWSSKGYSAIEDYNGSDPRDMFICEYEKFDNLFNGKNIFEYFKSQSMFKDKTGQFNYLKMIDEDYALSITKNELSRINGQIDIIIPYYNVTSEQANILYDFLKNQSIIDKCHIYLVSDCSPNEKMVFDKFFLSPLNITLLKTPRRMGPGGAREVGLQRSYNPYVFFLDADDLLINDKMFEDMLDLIQDKDIVCGNTIRIQCLNSGFQLDESFKWNKDTCLSQDAHCILYRRSFIEDNDIHYKEWYIGEDGDWVRQIEYRNPRIGSYEKESYAYLINLKNSIGSETSKYDKLFYRIIANIKGYNYRDYNDNWLALLDADQLDMNYSDMSDEQIENMVAISFYFCWLFYQNNKDKKLRMPENKEHFSYLLAENIVNENIQMTVNGKNFTSKSDYINLILQIVKESDFADNIMVYLEEFLYE